MKIEIGPYHQLRHVSTHLQAESAQFVDVSLPDLFHTVLCRSLFSTPDSFCTLMLFRCELLYCLLVAHSNVTSWR